MDLRGFKSAIFCIVSSRIQCHYRPFFVRNARCRLYKWTFHPAFFSGFGHFLAIFRHFPYIFLVCFYVSLQDCRPSLSLFSCFTSVLGFVVTKHKWPANEVGKGSVLVASEQDLEQRLGALGSRRVLHHGEGDTGRLAPGPDFRNMAVLQTQNFLSNAAHIAVINRKP